MQSQFRKPRYVTVSVVNSYIKRKLTRDKDLRNIYVKGEISNIRISHTGHCYFILKDEKSKIEVVIFKNNLKLLKFKPEEGMKVLISGELSVYEAGGKYNIVVRKISVDGLGDLYAAFEQLKKRLDKEGLFDKSLKKPIPKFPKRIGVVTAASGAAIKDIITTINRRWPLCEVILFPSLVQGEGAANNIASQIKFSQNYDLDTLIVGRGGGSIEDLWAFNEEIVARAIFECNIPVISAVGHEIDSTISDFVSDLRAPTPTAAAELAVPNLIEVNNELIQLNRRSNEAIKFKLNEYKSRFNNLIDKNLLKKPSLIYRDKELKLDELLMKLDFESKNLISVNKNELNVLKNSFIFKNPNLIYESKRRGFDEVFTKLNFESKNLILSNRNYLLELKNSFIFKNPLAILDNKSRKYSKIKLNLNHNCEILLNKKENDLIKYKENYILSNPSLILNKKEYDLAVNINKLEVLNPLNTLKRGYTFSKKDGKVVSSSKNLKKGDKLEVEFKDGSVNTEVI